MCDECPENLGKTYRWFSQIWHHRHTLKQASIFGVCIEAGAHLAIVEMAVAIDGYGVFAQQCNQECAEGGFLFVGAGVGHDTFIVDAADVGDGDRVSVVSTTMVYDVRYVVGLKDCAVLENNEVIADTRLCLTHQNIVGACSYVRHAFGTVDDDFGYSAHGGLMLEKTVAAGWCRHRESLRNILRFRHFDRTAELNIIIEQIEVTTASGSNVVRGLNDTTRFSPSRCGIDYIASTA